MSARNIELFRKYTEKAPPKHEAEHKPEHKPQKAQERSEQPKTPSLIAEMSRVEDEVRQVFDDASPADRENIIRFLELLIRNLKRALERGGQ